MHYSTYLIKSAVNGGLPPKRVATGTGRVVPPTSGPSIGERLGGLATRAGQMGSQGLGMVGQSVRGALGTAVAHPWATLGLLGGVGLGIGGCELGRAVNSAGEGRKRQLEEAENATLLGNKPQ